MPDITDVHTHRITVTYTQAEIETRIKQHAMTLAPGLTANAAVEIRRGQDGVTIAVYEDIPH